MKQYYLFFLLFIFSCTKEKLPISRKISLQGTFVFDNVTVSIIDNSVKKGSAFYDKGSVFINPYDVKGIDTIITDYSMMKIQNNKVFFDAEILKEDTIWNVSYDCTYNDIYSYKGALMTLNEAKSYCLNMSDNPNRQWRIANMQELSSMLQYKNEISGIVGKTFMSYTPGKSRSDSRQDLEIVDIAPIGQAESYWMTGNAENKYYFFIVR